MGVCSSIPVHDACKLIMGVVSLWTCPPACACAQDPKKAHPTNLGSLTTKSVLHVQDGQGIRRACIRAHVDAGTLSPAINTFVATGTCQWTACNSREIHVYPLEADTS